MEVVKGDLTKFHADVFVSAADERLDHEGGRLDHDGGRLDHEGGLAGAIVCEGNCSSHKYV